MFLIPPLRSPKGVLAVAGGVSGRERGRDGGRLLSGAGRQDGVPDGDGPACCAANVRERVTGQPAPGLEVQDVLEAVTDQPVPGVLAEGASGPAPLREAGRPRVDRLIRVVVHLGGFSRTDVLWASRQGGVHLLDGRQLQRWASGATLDDLGLPG
ncbi:hypothetical protein AB0C13_18810 [Streptomyces sp. NPDC049099]|uniref:hypothetical protein n=1 Tax=Streptomyces sp. NPDC049099 TaxID=3155768 RepID=UPI00343A8A9A